MSRCPPPPLAPSGVRGGGEDCTMKPVPVRWPAIESELGKHRATATAGPAIDADGLPHTGGVMGVHPPRRPPPAGRAHHILPPPGGWHIQRAGTQSRNTAPASSASTAHCHNNAASPNDRSIITGGRVAIQLPIQLLADAGEI